MLAFKATFLMVLFVSAKAAPQLGLDIANLGLDVEEEEPFNSNPQYAYSYQVADDNEQTYIAHQESRDGADVTGEYSYVDPLGNLVVVKYTAGVMGYTETREVQPNFVEIRRRTTVTSQAAPVAPAPAPAPAPVRQVVQQIQPVVQQVVQEQSNDSENDDDLVARIIAQLTPFIRNTVTTSLGSGSSASSSQSTTTTTTTASRPVVTSNAVPAVRRVSVPVANSQQTSTVTRVIEPAGSNVQSIFGLQGENNVKVNTPDFNFAYDL